MSQRALWNIRRGPSPERRVAFCQWNTPAWAAQELVDRYFPGLGEGDLVIEPSCGEGAFLKAIPAAVTAVGIELDPEVAAVASAMTGRKVIVGDFREVTIPRHLRPTVVLGNPPYRLDVIDGFLNRSRRLLPDNGRCGFLLPAYAMQSYGRVLRWNAHWSMLAEMVPRGIFPRLSLPLAFVLFTKDGRRVMVGFALYRQTEDVMTMSKEARLLLTRGAPGRSSWRGLVEETLRSLGGEARLPDLYAAISPRRPTPNPWWREKVRQILQMYFVRSGHGAWRLA